MSMAKQDAGQHGERNEQRDVPSPTIVGPRPEAGQHGKVTVPRGLERLLTLAGLNEEWKRKALADPVKTAGEAHIDLSASESAILKIIPRQTLGQMILSFARNRLTPVRDTALAAGAAAAALLATTGCDQQTATDGIRPDIPQASSEPAQAGLTAGISPDFPPSSEARQAARFAIEWETSLDTALAQAALSNRAVMVVCPLGGRQIYKKNDPPGTRGISIEIPSSPFLSDLCARGNNSVADAVSEAGVIAVKPPPGEEHATYAVRLQKYGVLDAAPLVFFLAPDGTVLSQLVQPAKEDKLVKAIRAVPPMLAEWITNQRRPITPPPPATKGMRGEPKL